MGLYCLILSFSLFFYACEAGVTEIRPDDDDVIIETVSEETWMPPNIFDVSLNTNDLFKSNIDDFRANVDNTGVNADDNVRVNTNDDMEISSTPEENTIINDLFSTEGPWNSDSSPIFRAIRDFIFQASDGILEEQTEEEPAGEIVKLIEKGLIEATTMFFNPPEDQISTTSATAEDTPPEISIVKIENVSPDTLLDRMGLNAVDMPSGHQTLSVTNATTECSDCYNSLQTCVQMCFTNHNCNDVQRQARVCPPPTSRICNIFAQWGPVDECKVHEDCTSPLLCCSDGCIKKCSPGVWQN